MHVTKLANLVCNVATWTELCNVLQAEGGSTPRGWASQKVFQSVHVLSEIP